jgi:hypothetical protein
MKKNLLVGITICLPIKMVDGCLLDLNQNLEPAQKLAPPSCSSLRVVFAFTRRPERERRFLLVTTIF